MQRRIKQSEKPQAVEEVQSAASELRTYNRELSWLQFNHRVLEEASNPKHPLLERLRFLSISASNLDEFYMVRVSGLFARAHAGDPTVNEEGCTAADELARINDFASRLTGGLVGRARLRAAGRIGSRRRGR